MNLPRQQRQQSDKTSKVFTRLLSALAILLIAGAVAWWGWLADPAFFRQGGGYILTVTEQEATINQPEETQLQAKRRVVKKLSEAELARLLAAAEADFIAVAETERAVENYMELFRVALEQEDFEQADTYLYRIRELRPDSPVLLAGEQRLASARQERTERLMQQARQRQEARSTELKRQRIAKVIKEHWEDFEKSMQADDLDKAADILVKVRNLNPQEPELAAGEQRLAKTKQARAKRLAEQEKRLVAVLKKLTEDMVEIPGGTFRMGDLSGEGFENERPVHSVSLPAFRMSKYEVTFDQWDTCVADGGCGNYTPNDNGWGRGNRPVINVSWYDIRSFIFWLNSKTTGGYHLPTESEWEYAARAGSTTEYSWGNSIGYNRANCNDDCGDRWERAAPVGRFPANAWGLHDMHGNVWEWVQGCSIHSYEGAPTDGSAWIKGCRTHPVVRGGSWATGPRYLRSAYRARYGHRSRNSGHQGFRLAQDR